jgi:hypothetical protein
MIGKTMMVATAALALAACGSEEEPAANNAVTEIIVRSDTQKQLFELNDLNRAIALKRAIRDFGPGCLRVVESGFVGRYKNMDYWTATCQDEYDRDRQWALFIGANDSVQVRLCEDVAKVGLPACTATANQMTHEEPPTIPGVGGE